MQHVIICGPTELAVIGRVSVGRHDAMTNFADRTIWTGDNLDILRGLNSASVDVIRQRQTPREQSYRFSVTLDL